MFDGMIWDNGDFAMSFGCLIIIQWNPVSYLGQRQRYGHSRLPNSEHRRKVRKFSENFLLK